MKYRLVKRKLPSALMPFYDIQKRVFFIWCTVKQGTDQHIMQSYYNLLTSKNSEAEYIKSSEFEILEKNYYL